MRFSARSRSRSSSNYSPGRSNERNHRKCCRATGHRPCGDVAARGRAPNRWPGPDSRSSGNLAGRRVKLLHAVLLAVAAAAAAAWLAGTRIESPADVAARTAPPPPSPILVPVEERVLSADVVTRGTVRFGLPQPVSLAPSPLKAAPGLVTTLPARNTQLNEGDVVLTASGRPVFVLQGQVPAYRDLVPGLSGADVRSAEAGSDANGL